MSYAIPCSDAQGKGAMTDQEQLHQETWDGLRAAVAATLKPFMLREFRAATSRDMQVVVDSFFLRKANAGYTFHHAEWGLDITGVEIRLRDGIATSGKWRTSWPLRGDGQWGEPTGPADVVLGGFGQYELYYLAQMDPLPPTIVARYGPGSDYLSFNPTLCGWDHDMASIEWAYEAMQRLSWLGYEAGL